MSIFVTKYLKLNIISSLNLLFFYYIFTFIIGRNNQVLKKYNCFIFMNNWNFRIEKDFIEINCIYLFEIWNPYLFNIYIVCLSFKICYLSFVSCYFIFTNFIYCILITNKHYNFKFVNFCNLEYFTLWKILIFSTSNKKVDRYKMDDLFVENSNFILSVLWKNWILKWKTIRKFKVL